MESSQFNAKFFEKPCKLILNLAESYWFKIKKNKWTNLQITLAEKNKYIDGIIGNDKNLITLFLNLNETLNRKLKVS